MSEIILPIGRGKERIKQLENFALKIRGLAEDIGFKISSRGWCYQLEGMGLINKNQFNWVQKLINECRKKGLVAWDFVMLDKSRSFSCIDSLDERPREYIQSWIDYVKKINRNYDGVDFWEGQKYYIQMMVEKIDLVTLFMPVCEKYHIPVANTKGWSDIGQRVRMIWRFKRAEEKGIIPVLLYCGDFDPAGVLISDMIRKNLTDLKKITGWLPVNLVINRFGLNYDFIEKAGLTWIDNLMTGSGKDLGDSRHPNYNDYNIPVWIEKYGRRKVEANALVVRPDLARGLCEKAVNGYVRKKAIGNFNDRVEESRQKVLGIMEDIGMIDCLDEAGEELKNHNDDEEDEE